jgi:hypothetical protein
VKRSEGLSNRASVVSGRNIDHMRFADYMAVSLITFFHIFLSLFCIIAYMIACFVRFCLIFVSYVFLPLCLCIVIVMYVPFFVYCFAVLFCLLFVSKCVLYYCHRVSTQLQLTYTVFHIIPYVHSRAHC